MIFVDTNYFLRFLLKDSEKQFLKTKTLFEDAVSGKLSLFTSTIVIFEIYWVLTSFYKTKRKSIYQNLTNIIDLGIILISDKEILLKALEIFNSTTFDLEDSYNLIYAKQNKTSQLATFDKKLEKAFLSAK